MKTDNLKGIVTENAPLGRDSWFGCGGSADMLFQPEGLEDLKLFLQQRDQTQPLTILGGLANTIVRDAGIRGCVIRMGRGLSAVQRRDNTHIFAEAGALNGSIAAAAMKAGIGGMEFLSGIPGTLGGAIAMNAGAYGTEMKDVLVEAYAVDLQGNDHVLTPEDLNMSYRHTDVPEYMMFTGALLRGQADTYEAVKTRMNDIKTRRNATQPIREKTGGSTFANPYPVELRHCGLPEDMRAWQVVEKVGGRRLRFGGAMMSPQHCNFMINTGDATASDLEGLGDELRKRALHDLGLKLRWEIKRIGEG